MVRCRFALAQPASGCTSPFGCCVAACGGSVIVCGGVTIMIDRGVTLPLPLLLPSVSIPIFFRICSCSDSDSVRVSIRFITLFLLSKSEITLTLAPLHIMTAQRASALASLVYLLPLDDIIPQLEPACRYGVHGLLLIGPARTRMNSLYSLTTGIYTLYL